MAVSKRGVNLDGWDVTWDEYKELDYFCRQYHRKKQEAENLLTLRVSTPQPVVAADGSADFPGRGGGCVSDPVAAMAEKRERLLRDGEARRGRAGALAAAGRDPQGRRGPDYRRRMPMQRALLLPHAPEVFLRTPRAAQQRRGVKLAVRCSTSVVYFQRGQVGNCGLSSLFADFGVRRGLSSSPAAGASVFIAGWGQGAVSAEEMEKAGAITGVALQ